MAVIRVLWTVAVAWLSNWWTMRGLRKAAAQGEGAKVAAAYAERDNASLRAENAELNHMLEEKAHEPTPTSYDGNTDALAEWMRRRNAARARTED